MPQELVAKAKNVRQLTGAVAKDRCNVQETATVDLIVDVRAEQLSPILARWHRHVAENGLPRNNLLKQTQTLKPHDRQQTYRPQALRHVGHTVVDQRRRLMNNGGDVAIRNTTSVIAACIAGGNAAAAAAAQLNNIVETLLDLLVQLVETLRNEVQESVEGSNTFINAIQLLRNVAQRLIHIAVDNEVDVTAWLIATRITIK